MFKPLLLIATLLLATTNANAGKAARNWPASMDVLPTTAGDIYLDNLDRRIEVLDTLRQRRTDGAGAAALAGALYHRYRIRGDLDDAERAFVLADEAVAAPDADAETYVLRATLRSGFHRFDDAQADLAVARTRGLPATQAEAMQHELALATGRYDELRQAFDDATRNDTDAFDALAFRGHLRQLQGDDAGAEALYARAQAAYVDSSPVPLAWLYVQQGIAFLDASNPRRARDFFAAARERLPGYTLATEHLAETEALLGHCDRARALYREAIADSQDPAFVDALAQLEADAGKVEEAARLAAQARLLWEARLSRYPQAYGGHAIEYFLDQQETRRALALARDNLDVRRDVLSLVLAARVADQAGQHVEACQRWREAGATGLSPPQLRALDTWAVHCR